MKTLVIFGSPRQNGFTAKLLGKELQDTEAEIYNAYGMQTAPCDACGGCKETGVCVKPDNAEFFKKLRDCEKLIIASPIYNFSVPSPLKAVFDRTQQFYFSPEKPVHKDVTLLLTCGRSGERSVPCVTEQIKIAAGNFGGEITSVKIENFTDKKELQ